MKCFRCEAERPLEELNVLDAQPGGPAGGEGPWRVVIMCGECYDELDPDMWTCEEHWMAMKPAVPFGKLPLGESGAFARLMRDPS